VSDDDGVKGCVRRVDLHLVAHQSADLRQVGAAPGSDLDHPRGNVGQHDSSRAADPAGSRDSRAARPAGELDHIAARADAGSTEQRIGGRGEVGVDEVGLLVPRPRNAVPHLGHAALRHAPCPLVTGHGGSVSGPC